MTSERKQIEQITANNVALRDQYIVVGGEALPLEVIRTWHNKGVPIRQGYGLTEVGPNVTSLNQEDAERKLGSIGTPNFYIQTKIIDENGNVVKDYGESCVIYFEKLSKELDEKDLLPRPPSV